jgi:DNA-binding LytR/AlgR family response regulator
MGLAAVGAACVTFSLAAGAFLEPNFDLVFELVRRVPGLVVVSALLIIGRMLPGDRLNAATASLPLPPAQIEWIAAAGNYVEIHSAGRTILHRAPISGVEAELGPHGFVRVHRSTLVRRDRIARVRRLDIVLQDGTSLRTGQRIRSGLRD